jgi:hypothetical protein
MVSCCSAVVEHLPRHSKVECLSPPSVAGTGKKMMERERESEKKREKERERERKRGKEREREKK